MYNNINTRFESEECEVLLSLSEQEASLLGEEVRDVLIQPVDHQPFSSAANLLKQLSLTTEEHGKRHDIRLSCSRNNFYHYYDSPSARLTTPTLTRDVPEQSDEPLVAVGVVSLQPRASIDYYSLPNQSNTSLFPNIECDYTPYEHHDLDSRNPNIPKFDRNNNSLRRPPHTANDSESDSMSTRKTPSFAIQWNICGLRSHQHELQLLIRNYQPIIVCLQETNADHHRIRPNFLGNNYEILLSQCSTHGRQGAGMAIKKGTPFQRIDIQSNIQAIVVQLYAPVAITVVSVYLPPRDRNAAKALNDLMKEIPKPILLLGDLNAHHTAWGSRMQNSSHEAKKRGEEILNLVVQHDMIVLNNGCHTRIDPATGESQALDVSICSTNSTGLLSKRPSTHPGRYYHWD